MTTGPPFDDWLAERLRRPLPGRAAQARLAPKLAYGRHSGPPAHDARATAVLALVYRQGDAWRVPLTKRPAHLRTHAGQWSFPGGKQDPGETLAQTALRELVEETGCAGVATRLLGELTPLYVFNSNHHVTPFVASASGRPTFQCNPNEVEELGEFSLEEVAAPGNLATHEVRRRGLSFRAPRYQVAGQGIWGATSMMLAELLALYAEWRGG